jgi:cyclic pyranopterin phosphate synthase
VPLPLPVLDRFRRPLKKLRLSVTDRCDLRCSYCMPEETYAWLPKRDILSFEELARVADVFLALGADEIRLTGGEPLLRRDLAKLVGLLAAKKGLADLALTTNGTRLAELAATLRAAGLHRLTISLDTLDRERFRTLARRDELPAVLAGIDAARAAGFSGTKLNMVVLRGKNDDELAPMLEFARAREMEPRFIEYMDVGGATRWSMDDVVGEREILARLERRFGAIERVPVRDPNAPAVRYRVPALDGAVFGIISSTTRPFCGTCDRSRLTADGVFYLCLYAKDGLDLRAPLRAGASAEELARLVTESWRARSDRGAEERLRAEARGPLEPHALRADPHLEMHTRGG